MATDSLNHRPYEPCLEPGPYEQDGMGTSCLKWQNHRGPHDFARNDWIMTKFKVTEDDFGE